MSSRAQFSPNWTDIRLPLTSEVYNFFWPFFKYQALDKNWQLLEKLRLLKEKKLRNRVDAFTVVRELLSELGPWIRPKPEIEKAIARVSVLDHTRPGPRPKDLEGRCALEWREMVRSQSGKYPRWQNTTKIVSEIFGSPVEEAWLRQQARACRERDRLANDPTAAATSKARRAKLAEERQNRLDPGQQAYNKFSRFIELARKTKPTDAELAEMRPSLKKLGGGDTLKGWKEVNQWNGKSNALIWKNLLPKDQEKFR